MAADSFLAIDRVGLWSVALVLALGAFGSALAARLYLTARGPHLTGADLHRAAPVLGLAVTALLVTVQFSLPLSLGLLAALTLTRVRTPVKEPEEIALVLLVTAVGVAVASFKLGFLGGLLLVGLLASWCTRYIASRTAGGFSRVIVRLPAAGVSDAHRALGVGSIAPGITGELRSIGAGPDGLRLEFRLPRLTDEGCATVRAHLASEVPAARVEIGHVTPGDGVP